MQPRPPLTPQTHLKSWCHSLESTSLKDGLGQVGAAPVEVHADPVDPDNSVDPDHSVMDPTTAQRLAQKSSGPFDTEPPDVTLMNDHVASAEDDAISMTTVKGISGELDLYKLLQDDGLGEPSDTMANTNADDFVDLFDYLLQNDTDKTDSHYEQQSGHPSASRDDDIIVGNKRSYEVLSDSSSVLSDHSSYTKVKHTQSHVSTTLLTSDTESETGSSSGSASLSKHMIRRLKNNVASRRSRQTRKQKYVSMEKKAAELETANAELQDRVAVLEQLAKEMKDKLIKFMSR